ncbi:MAG: thiamine-phosphate kinase [Candidatus Aminicenantaceae bacterium]
MKLKTLEEEELISAIRREYSELSPEVIVGIGDDAAVIKFGKKHLIVTKDVLLEGVHFLVNLHPPYLLGRKSLYVNLSDIAAMGGVSKYSLLGLGLPPKTDPDWLKEYLSGFKSAADEQGVSLVGGDVSESKRISISVSVIGEGKKIIQRNGAEEEHLIFVSGSLGDAAQGLILLKKGYRLGDDERADVFLKAFLDPCPPVSLGSELSRFNAASSMIDVSDGLSVDLHHLCKESGVGAEIYVDKLPLSPEINRFQKRPYRLALHGGEDYQLLFTVPSHSLDSIEKLKKKYRITFIGKIIKEKRILTVDRRGKRKPLEIQGYQHFKKSKT